MALVGILSLFLLQAAPAAEPVVVAPHWVRRPAGEDLARVYPIPAQRANMAGRAVMSCSVTAAGLLTNCVAASESPAGQGFGEAALKLAPLFAMSSDVGGQSVAGGTVRIPIIFRLPGGGYDQLTGLLACYGRAATAAERQPGDSGKAAAAQFWAAQGRAAAAAASEAPSEVERDLEAARMSASSTPAPALFRDVASYCDHAYAAAQHSR